MADSYNEKGQKLQFRRNFNGEILNITLVLVQQHHCTPPPFIGILAVLNFYLDFWKNTHKAGME